MIRRALSRAPVSLVFLLILALAGACSSSPKTPETEPAAAAPAPPAPASPEPAPPKPAETPEPETLAALEDASARLERARSMARDFGGERYLPEETAAADTRYAALKPGAPGTEAEAREALAAVLGLAETYEGIFERALPSYAEDRTAEIREVRERAVFMGILAYSPERLDVADDAGDEARRLYEDGEDYYAARDAAGVAEDRYRALALGAEALNEAYEIEFYEFGALDPEGYTEANRLFDGGLAAYDAGEVGDALAAAGSSLALYRGILDRGMKVYAGERRLAAEAERGYAEECKAPVAVRAEFESAARIFGLGEAAYGREEYREAANLYFQAEFGFAAAATTAEEKRLRAEAAIRRAEEVTAASEVVAQNAEDLITAEVEE